jgi:two-component system cell cycle sensor histidine kinase/response regulator CckA
VTKKEPPLVIDPSVATTLNAAPYAVLLVADDGRVVFENPKADVLFGCGTGRLVGRSVEDLVPDRFRETHVAHRARFTKRRGRRPMGRIRDLVALRADGSEVPVEISLSSLTLADRTVTMAVVVHLDAEHTPPPDESSLRSWTDSSGELYYRLVQTAPIGIYRSSPEGLLLYANPALAHMLGHDDASELLGMSLGRDVYADPADRVRVLHDIEEGVGSAGIHVRLRRRDGSVITVRITSHAIRDDSGAVVCYEGAVDDVTDRLRVDADLHRMRRMESATRLAGGMSHSLNNVLTSVLGSVQLAAEALSAEDSSVRSDLREAERGLLRATHMLAKLRSISAVDEIHSERMDLRAFLVAWAERLDPAPGVTVALDVPDDAVHVDLDPGGLVEVLENLVSNAVDAMPDGGRISVALSTSTGGGGDWAVLDVTDTGMGMSDTTLERALEPYYTTKARQMTSAGAGLGLSLVYGIVRQHGGDVVLTSTLGQGTTVRLRLPLRDG